MIEHVLDNRASYACFFRVCGRLIFVFLQSLWQTHLCVVRVCGRLICVFLQSLWQTYLCVSSEFVADLSVCFFRVFGRLIWSSIEDWSYVRSYLCIDMSIPLFWESGRVGGTKTMIFLVGNRWGFEGCVFEGRQKWTFFLVVDETCLENRKILLSIIQIYCEWVQTDNDSKSRKH